MRVLFISSSSRTQGGGEIYLTKLGKALAQEGHGVGMICSNNEKMNGLSEEFAKWGQVFLIPYQNTYNHPLKSLKYTLPGKSISQSLMPIFQSWAPDIIHLNKQNLEDGLDLLKDLSRAKVPCQQTIHLLRTPQELSARMGSLRTRVAAKYLRKYPIPSILIASRPKRVNFERKDILPTASLRRIANGVDAVPAAPTVQTDKALNFLALSRLHAQKRPRLWINWTKHVADAVSQVQFDWCGDGMQEAEFLERVEQLDLRDLNYHG